VRSRGYVVGNADLTLLAEAPRLKAYREAMQQRVAELLEVPVDAVGLKATTTEQMGFTGRREGLAAQAAVMLWPAVTGP
jgi:2-C-methyl-D-erythritol 2,4-cyclodiphosphate synthase